MAASGTAENPLGTTLPIPPQPWLYAYSDPPDSLFMRGILPIVPTTNGASVTPATILAATNLSNGGEIPFKMAYATDNAGNPIQIVLCNLSQAQAVYTVNQPSPVIWDSLLENAFVATLAAYLCPGINANMPLMAACIKEAEAAILSARTADGNETPASQNRQASWISARMGGTCVNNDGSNSQYSEMLWPSSYYNGNDGNIS